VLVHLNEQSANATWLCRLSVRSTHRPTGSAQTTSVKAMSFVDLLD
jgi:hypothetical protein